MAPTPQDAATIKSWAHELGFDLVGIARPGISAYAGAYQDWIAAGKHGEMAYLARNIDERLDLTRKFSWAKSVLCVAISYWREQEESEAQSAETGRSGKIARYAWGRDYHRMFEHKLKKLEARIRTVFAPGNPDLQIRPYCDTGPLLERELAARAGLGWIGKHTLLIHPEHGSWFLLGELVLSLDLPADSSLPDHCGTCTRCVDACPTNAIRADAAPGSTRSVDARRCISYLTLEHRGPIAPEFETPMRDAAYLAGCDICQQVCPFNGAQSSIRSPMPARDPDFSAHPPAPSIPLQQVLAWQEADWDQLTRGRAFRRAKLPMWQRTAKILAGP